MIKGHLKLIVMKVLSEGERSGYQIMKKIEEITGYKKPSSGSIYPLLDHLLSEKLVDMREDGREKIYSLTKEGEKTMHNIIEHRDKILEKLIEGCNIFERLFQKKDVTTIKDILQNLKQDKAPFDHASPEIIELRITLHNLIKEGKMQRNKNEARKILAVAVKGLKKLK